VVAVSLEKQEGIVTKRKAKEITDLILYAIRPALAEAHLITGKQASDLVYAATLAEELRGIEKKLALLESDLHLTPPSDAMVQTPGECPTAKWIRSKSAALEVRLRRVEKSCEGESLLSMRSTGEPVTDQDTHQSLS
jgi:hypothetical protein